MRRHQFRGAAGDASPILIVGRQRLRQSWMKTVAVARPAITKAPKAPWVIIVGRMSRPLYARVSTYDQQNSLQNRAMRNEVSKAEIGRRLQIGDTSVRRILKSKRV